MIAKKKYIVYNKELQTSVQNFSHYRKCTNVSQMLLHYYYMIKCLSYS